MNGQPHMHQSVESDDGLGQLVRTTPCSHHAALDSQVATLVIKVDHLCDSMEYVKREVGEVRRITNKDMDSLRRETIALMKFLSEQNESMRIENREYRSTEIAWIKGIAGTIVATLALVLLGRLMDVNLLQFF